MTKSHPECVLKKYLKSWYMMKSEKTAIDAG
jgi:hypothetical protein